MSNGGMKSLVWDIRKNLLALSAEELFRVARAVDPALDADRSGLMEGDQEVNYDHINSFMYSKQSLETEDEGMVQLLMLKDTIDDVVKSPQSHHTPISVSMALSSDMAAPDLGLVKAKMLNAPDTANTDLLRVLSKKLIQCIPAHVTPPQTQMPPPSIRPSQSNSSPPGELTSQSAHEGMVSLRELS